MTPSFTPAPLGPRAVAWILDHALPVVLALVTGLVLGNMSGGLSATSFVVLVVCLVLTAGWGVYLWWSGGERGATPGLRLMGLQVVSVKTGRPVGWGRYLARMVTVSVLAATGVGWPLMLIWLTAHRQRRGWHDLVAEAIVAQRPRIRTTFESPRAPSAGHRSVPLPAHLRAWAPQEEPRSQMMGGPADHAPAPVAQESSIPSASGGYAPAEVTGPVPSAAANDPVQGTVTGGPRQGAGMGPSAGPTPSSAIPERAWAPPTADATVPPPFGDQSQTPPVHSQPPVNQYGASAQPSREQPQPPAQSQPQQPVQQRPAQPRPTAQPSPPAADPDRTSLRPTQDDPDVTALRPQENEDPDRTSLRSEMGALSAPVQPPPPKWQVVLEDGRVIPLDRAAILGRRPSQPPGKPVHLITVEDTTKTLSKSHIRVDADDDSPFVTDLGSTNGSALVTSTGQVDLRPQQPRRIPGGQVVKFGEQRFTVERTPRP